MAEAPEILAAAKVIGDVLEPFTPEAELMVRYGSETVSNGCEIKPLEAKNRPYLQVSSYNPHPDDLYTLVRRTLVEYMGPQPSTGKHRYVFGLYKQKGPLVKPRPLPPEYARGNFNTRHFASHNDLGQPVAALFFNSRKEANIAYDN